MNDTLASRHHTYQPRPISLTACRRHFGRARPLAEGQRDAGARGTDIARRAAPDSFDRHAIVGGIHQIQYAGLRVMPERHAKRNARRSLAQVLGIPVGQCSRTDHGLPGLVGQRQQNRISPFGTLNDAGIRNINLALRPCWQCDQNECYPRENCPRKVCEIKTTET